MLDLIKQFLEFVLHIDKYLVVIIDKLGSLVYFLLFLIIFAETGLVVTPFLPGDSLLFTVGAFAAQGSLNILILFLILSIAAIIGDSVNYNLGKYVGPKVFKEDSKYFKKEYLIKTEEFYEKYGQKTILIARFMPIIRTFAPFVAGIGRMQYSKFVTYNICGAILWVGAFLAGGYYFGNIPIVKENFSVVIIIIILVSMLPGIIRFIQYKLETK